MTQAWRGDPEDEDGMGRLLRHRWVPGSVYVLNVDRLICDPKALVGLLIEEKHASSHDRTWRVTRQIARGLGWWAALFVYETDDGTPRGEVTRIDATFADPESGRFYEKESMSMEWFSDWVCRHIGARLP
jgi:hypothetical protein